MTRQHRLLVVLALLGCMTLTSPASAYIPQTYNPAIDTGQDFTKVPSGTPPLGIGGINQKIWNHIFWYGGTNNPGAQFQFSGSTGLWILSYAAKGWPNTGMMQFDDTCSAGFGYGDFHWRSAEGLSTDGPGSNEIMWPADGDAGWPGIIAGSSNPTISEIDVNEVNYTSNDQSYATLHYFNASAGGNNGQIIKSPISFPTGTMTSMHDYDVVWGPGSLVLYVDGVAQMTAPATQVRADFAHGGCNYTLGAQMAMEATSEDKTPQDWIEIAAMWWSATNGSAGGSPAPSPNQTPTITISAPGTVTAPASGAGVTETMTVTVTALTGSIYAEVVTAKGAVETSGETIQLGGNTTALFPVHFDQTGDYLVVGNQVPNPTVVGVSAPVTIINP